MQTKHMWLFSLLVATISCHKGADPVPNPPGDKNVIRLKDVTERNLPAPYYHFEYDDSGYVTHTSFLSGLRMYDVIYAGKKIQRIENKNQTNGDIIQYKYNNGELSVIEMTDKNGIIYKRGFLGYTPSGQLQMLDWEIKDGSVGFVQEETIQFSYHADGNLKKLIDHYYNVGSQTDHTIIDSFTNYDSKVNVDAFSLLHRDQGHHLFLLPGIKLQLNNPRRNIRTGDGINYEIDYTYTYDAAGRPQRKDGDVLWRSGADSGKHFAAWMAFTYYD